MRPLKGSPAGGGYSTLDDLLKFSTALHDHKLLSQKYTEIITSGKVEMGAAGRKYAYGFGEDVSNGRHIVGHNGGGPGISANFDMLLDTGYTAVILLREATGTLAGAFVTADTTPAELSLRTESTCGSAA